MLDFIIRRFTTSRDDARDLRGTVLQSLAVAQVEAPDMERTRAGVTFDIGFASGVTGIAPVQAIPTTAAQWLLFLPADTTPSAVFIDEIGVVLVSGTAGAGIVLYGALVGAGSLPSTLPAQHAANVFTRPRADGKAQPQANSSLVVASGQTLAAAPPRGWAMLAKSGDSGATAILSTAVLNAELNGGICIRPGQGLALWVGSPAGTTPLFVPHCVYTEIQTDLE